MEQNFDTVLNEIFADSSLNIGRQKMCELFDVTRFDKDVIKNLYRLSMMITGLMN